MTEIYTSTYSYSGSDRFDITVKGNDPEGIFFAPTWKMVTGIKNGTMKGEEYIKLYHAILGIREMHFRKLLKRKRIVAVCFCKSNSFCHRYLFANWITKHYPNEAIYKGEI